MKIVAYMVCVLSFFAEIRIDAMRASTDTDEVVFDDALLSQVIRDKKVIPDQSPTHSSGLTDHQSPASPAAAGDSPLSLPPSAVFCRLPTRTPSKKYGYRWLGPRVPVIDVGRPRDIVQGIRTVRALNVQGQPTIAYLEKILNDHMPDIGPVNFTEVSGDASPALVYTLCRATEEKPLFVLKIDSVVDHEEQDASHHRTFDPWEKLSYLQRGAIGKLGWQHGLQKKFPYLPILTSVECFFTYTDNQGNKRVIELLHAARGVSVYDFLMSRRIVPEHVLQQYGLAVGRSLASFHRVMAHNNRTEIHGDLHPKNVFVEALQNTQLSPEICVRKSGVVNRTSFTGAADAMMAFLTSKVGQPVVGSYNVFLIDNETMYHKKRRNQFIDWDINAFIMVPLLYWKWLQVSADRDDFWQSLVHFYTAFITGYVAHMPESYRSYLKSILCAWIDTVDHILQELDALAEGSPIVGADTIFNGSISADEEGDYWHVVDTLFYKVWLHPDSPHFFEAQTNVLNTFIKNTIKASVTDHTLQNMLARLHGLKRAFLSVLD